MKKRFVPVLRDAGACFAVEKPTANLVRKGIGVAGLAFA